MSTESDHTPRPGRVLKEIEKAVILSQFLKKYRINEPSSNLPTACTLGGVESSDFLGSEKFRSLVEVYVLFENPRELYAASAESFLGFFEARYPWEDYDLCVFDPGLTWCVGITHNGRILLVE